MTGLIQDSACPGMFNQGCPLHGRLLVVPPELPGQRAFQGCSQLCGFKQEFVMQMPDCVLEFELLADSDTVFESVHRHAGAFRIRPAAGAEDAVARAGGCEALLLALQVDRSLFLRPEEVNRYLSLAGQRSYSGDAAYLPLGNSAYEMLEKLIIRSSQGWQAPDGGRVIIPQGNRIPSATRASFRNGFKHLREAPEAVHSYFESIPKPVRAALKPFQESGVKFVLEREGRALIADEMGLGKTLQAIALMAAYRADWPALVVVPASCRLQWAEELERWLPDILPPSEIHIIYGSSDRVRPESGLLNEDSGFIGAHGKRKGMPLVTICSYHMVERLTCPACKGVKAQSAAQYRKVPGAGRGSKQKCSGQSGCLGPCHCMAQAGWGIVVMDESHTMRTSASQMSGGDSPMTEALASLARRGPGGCRRCIMLSGTPSLTRPLDIFRQIHCLRPNLLGSRSGFADRYCDRRLVSSWRPKHSSSTAAPAPDATMTRWAVSGGRFLGELHQLLTKEVMIRRLKADVALELPDKERHVVHLRQPPVDQWPVRDKNSLKAVQDEDGLDDDWDIDGDDEQKAGQQETITGMSSCRRLGLAKVHDVLEWLSASLLPSLGELADSRDVAESFESVDGKLLVFAHHCDVMDSLHEGMSRALADMSEMRSSNDMEAWNMIVRIDGSTEAQERAAGVRRFRDDPRCKVALLSITAAGTGLDFSAASAVVFAEIPGDVGLLLQAEARAHRTGCNHPVTCYFLLSKNTSDGRRWQRLGAQLSRQRHVLDGVGNTNNGNGGDKREVAAFAVEAQQLPVDWIVDVESGTVAKPQTVKDSVIIKPSSSASQINCEASMVQGALATGSSETGYGAVGLGSTGRFCESPECSITHVSASYEDEERGIGDSGEGEVTSIDYAKQEKTLHKSSPSIINKPKDKDQEINCQELRGNGPQQQIDLAASCTEVMFEVSKHTSRVHFFSANELPLGFSLPMESVLMLLEEDGNSKSSGSEGSQINKPQAGLRKSVENNTPYREAWAWAEAARLLGLDLSGSTSELVIGNQHSRPGASVVGEAIQQLGIVGLARAMEDAAALMGEWMELRPIERSRLAGCIIRLPLQDAVEQLREECANDGSSKGRGTSRRLQGPAKGILPDGAEWKEIKVESRFSKGQTMSYSQAFSKDGHRLCLHCLSPVAGFQAETSLVLSSCAALFCCSACEGEWRIATCPSAARRALFRLEKGICQECGLDCNALLRRLQVIRKGSRNWKMRRKLIVYQVCPAFAEKRMSKWLELMVTTAVAGHVWQADHINPVHQGGGGCGIENLRTLCVRCHSIVTAQQASNRAAARRAANRKSQKLAENEIPSASYSHLAENLNMGAANQTRRKPIIRAPRPPAKRCIDSSSDDD